MAGRSQHCQEATYELCNVVTGRGLASEEDDLRVDLLALLGGHVLEGQVPLQGERSAIIRGKHVAALMYSHE